MVRSHSVDTGTAARGLRSRWLTGSIAGHAHEGSGMNDERRSRKFRYILGTLAVVAAVTGGAAYAASKEDSPQARSQAIVDDAAGTLGVAPSKLSDALKKALENQVDAQVT